MKPYVGITAFAIALAFGSGTTVFADGPGRAQTGPVSPEQIRGEVSKIDGDNITVKDLLSGKDVKFGLEQDMKAKLERPLSVGDKIEAQLTPEGFAKDIRVAAKSMDQKDIEQRDKMMNKGSGKGQAGPRDLGTIQAPGPEEPNSGKK